MNPGRNIGDLRDMKISKVVSALIFVWCLSQIFAVEGRAQATAPVKPDTSKKEAELDLKKKQEDVKVFLDKIEILGRIEKPQTVFIIPGKDPAVEDIHIDRSFFKEIFRSVEKDDIARRNEKAHSK